MPSRRILIVTDTLCGRGGVEMATRDLALGLSAAGENITVFAAEGGPVAEEIAAAGVAVVSDLEKIAPAPDIVHGHEHSEMVRALLAFPSACGVFVCHARFARESMPPLFSRITRYVAVDENCLERLLEFGIARSQARVIFNTVDTARFRKRWFLLPAKPRRALIFSNYTQGACSHLDAVKSACAQRGLALKVIGVGAGGFCAKPERMLPRYDLVFAKARCALEAMAAGCAVIICDQLGLGPLVTSAKVAELRRWNFGMRTQQLPLAPAHIAEQIALYDPADARRVSQYIRQEAALGTAITSYRALYDEIAGEQASPSPDELLNFHIAHAGKTAALETELWKFRHLARTEALTEAAAGKVRLTMPRSHGCAKKGELFWLPCRVENQTGVPLGQYPPAPILLSYHWCDLEMLPLVYEGIRTSLIPALEAGAAGNYELKIQAPEIAGDYFLRVTLVQDGVRWFDELSPPVCVDVPMRVR